MRQLQKLTGVLCVAVAIATPWKALAQQYTIRVYPEDTENESQIASKTFASDLKTRVRAIQPVSTPKHGVVSPSLVYQMAIISSGGGEPAGVGKNDMKQTIAMTKDLALIQQRSSSVANLVTEFLFEDKDPEIKSAGLTANFARVFTMPNDGVAKTKVQAITLNQAIVYLIAAREAFKLNRYAEAMLYVDRAKGLVGKSALSSEMNAVVADLDKLKAKLIAVGAGLK